MLRNSVHVGPLHRHARKPKVGIWPGAPDADAPGEVEDLEEERQGGWPQGFG